MGASRGLSQSGINVLKDQQRSRFQENADSYRSRLAEINSRIASLASGAPASGTTSYADLQTLRARANQMQRNITGTERQARRMGVQIQQPQTTPGTTTA